MERKLGIDVNGLGTTRAYVIFQTGPGPSLLVFGAIDRNIHKHQ